jgi:hypothetical protein
MPYKDPERKRQWEQEHREQRNARRRRGEQLEPIVLRSTPDPFPAKEQGSAWMVVAGMGALMFMVVLGVLVALGRASASLDSGPGRPSA